MTIPVTVGGNPHLVPETGDTTWGPDTTSLMVDLADLKMDFPPIADVDFGGTYGLAALYFSSRLANAAVTGTFRLTKSDYVAWRNNANSADLALSINASDELLFNGTPVTTDAAAWGNITGILSAQTDLQSALDGKATSAQGALADSALQSGDNNSVLVNDSNYLTVITGEVINDLSDVVITTPVNGNVLSYVAGNWVNVDEDTVANGMTLNGIGDVNVGIPSLGQDGYVLQWNDATSRYTLTPQNPGVTNHTLLTNIGTNTHAQIDTHIGTAGIHFTEASISITESQISDLQSYLLAGNNISVLVNDSGYITNITSGAIRDLSDVLTSMTPINGQVLTYDGLNTEWISSNPVTGVTDHLLLSNIGANNHAQIDSHIADTTLHFTKASISINDLSNVYTPMSPIDGQVLTYDTTNGWQSETSPVGVTNHVLLSNIGTNTHAQIDSHISDGSLHYTKASINIADLGDVVIGGSPLVATQVLTYNGTNWVNEDASGGGGGVSDHTLLTNIGTNTHAQIDTFILTGLQDADIGVNVEAYDATILKDADIGVTIAPVRTTINNQTGTTYTLVLSDAQKYVRMNNISPNDLTVPPNSAVAFPVGTQVDIRQVGNTTTILSGVGVTINLEDTNVLRGTGATVTLIKVATDEWDLMGSTVTAGSP